MIKTILKDTEGLYNYRSALYKSPNNWPHKHLQQILITLKFYRQNFNGFRDLVYYRIRKQGNRFYRILYKFLRFYFKPTSSLILDVANIEEGGCYFHHAFSSYINAEFIGRGTTVRNNTTIGNKLIKGKNCRPIIGRNVFVGPNVVIIGDVTIGDNVVIGAGAVVTKNVRENTVVAGNPAREIEQIKQ